MTLDFLMVPNITQDAIAIEIAQVTFLNVL